MCWDALVIVEVGDSQAVPKVWAQLFPRDSELWADVAFNLFPQHHGALGLIPGSPCHHCVVVMAQQLLCFKNWITCSKKCDRFAVKLSSDFTNQAHVFSMPCFLLLTINKTQWCIFTHITESFIQLSKVMVCRVPRISWFWISPCYMDISFNKKASKQHTLYTMDRFPRQRRI